MHSGPKRQRSYAPILQRLRPRGSRTQLMTAVVDALWAEFAAQGVSWAGFYLLDTSTAASDAPQLTLGPRRDKPACSPIGLNGACGRCFTSKRPLVVTDVANLGANYIACDPRDKSEVVVPALNPDGTCWGVLDVDSHEAGAFDVGDAMCLQRLLRHVGLSTHVLEEASVVDVV